MKKKTIIDLFEAEIAWCKENPLKKSVTWQEGFMKGIEQAIILIKKLNEN